MPFFVDACKVPSQHIVLVQRSVAMSTGHRVAAAIPSPEAVVPTHFRVPCFRVAATPDFPGHRVRTCRQVTETAQRLIDEYGLVDFAIENPKAVWFYGTFHDEGQIDFELVTTTLPWRQVDIQ